MDTNGEVFRNFSPTAGAKLRGVPGRNLHHLLPSFRRFESQDGEKLEPGHISHLPSEAAVKAVPSTHVLNVNGIVCSNELVGKLKVKI